MTQHRWCTYIGGNGKREYELSCDNFAGAGIVVTVLAACQKLAKREFDPMTGEYEGTFTPQGGQATKAEAKVIADGDNKYRVVILYPPLLPKLPASS